MPIPDVLKSEVASLVENAQISSLQQGVTLLCLIGEAGWWVDGWDIGIGIGRGGIATGIAKQSTSIGSPVLCCCISPWGGRQIENVRNIRTFTLSFSSSLLWEGFRKNGKHFFSLFEPLPRPFLIGSSKIARNFRCAHCCKWLTIQTLKLELILRKRKVATNKVFSLFWMVRLKVDLEICPKRTAWEKFSECNSPRVQVANCAGANQGHCRSICCSFLLVFCKGDDL